MSILTQLRQLEKQITRYQDQGESATEEYRTLESDYQKKLKAAKDYQSILLKDYNDYVQAQTSAESDYSKILQEKYDTYQGVLKQIDESDLKKAYDTATTKLGELSQAYDTSVSTAKETIATELSNLKGVAEETETKAGELYQAYSDTYDTALANYEEVAPGFKKALEEAETAGTELYSQYESDYSAALLTGQKEYESALQGALNQKNYAEYQLEDRMFQSEGSYTEYNARKAAAELENELAGQKWGGSFYIPTGDPSMVWQASRSLNPSTVSNFYDQESKTFNLPKYDQITLRSISSTGEIDPPKVDNPFNVFNVTLETLKGNDPDTVKQVLDLVNEGKGFKAEEVVRDYFSNTPGLDQSAMEKTIQSNLDYVSSKLSPYQTELEKRTAGYQGWLDRYNKYAGLIQNYQDLSTDTEYVTRYATEEASGSLKAYEDYVADVYTPAKEAYQAIGESPEDYATSLSAESLKTYQDYQSSTASPAATAYQDYSSSQADTLASLTAESLKTYQDYESGTYAPAKKAYEDYVEGTTLATARQDYENFIKDSGFVDRGASDAKSVYDASLQNYQNLQASYQELEKPLSQYASEISQANEKLGQLNLLLPRLQRSLRVEQDPRKREVRIGYGRSLMTSGTKRRSSVR